MQRIANALLEIFKNKPLETILFLALILPNLIMLSIFWHWPSIQHYLETYDRTALNVQLIAEKVVTISHANQRHDDEIKKNTSRIDDHEQRITKIQKDVIEIKDQSNK